MGLLEYTSNEMFSSTELIRKSKKIFDKINDKEIEKAIILRDGKPNFILIDFNTYESIIAEYLKLKNEKKISKQKKELKTIKENIQIKEEKIEASDSIKEQKNEEELLENALKEIDKLEIKKEKEPLKDFWN